MNCLDEAALLRVSTGDATNAERRHATACATCSHALAMLQADLGRLGAVLGDGVPVRRAARSRGMRLVPIAAAAVLVLAIALGRRSPAPVAEGDELAMLDDLGTAVATYDVAGLSDDDDGTTAGSTCTWGEPLFETGCDDDAPVTLIAWR
jgi:hypothetical protein